ncbi:MAG TPA: glycine/betaine ABC transporter substrate-binding protein, partial [Thermoanaerobacterales bacterium]|nr:glycine/betaine ABC transporter substrate-binding protein [Thermoanaerobacterales bacterium]
MFFLGSKRRVLGIIVGLIIIIGLLSGCGSEDATDEPTITVSCKPWTEQLILGNMLLDLFEANGYPAEDELGLGETPTLRPALKSGQIDVYWEYTGSILMTEMGEEQVSESEEAFNKVKEWDEEENDLIWLDYAQANNTYTLMMKEERAKSLGIESISDLAEYINDGEEDIILATNIEFFERSEDGVPGIEEIYGFEFDRDKMVFVTTGLTYDALRNDDADVAMGFGTDGRIPAFNFVNLEDNEGFFPIYNPAPIIRPEILEAYPELPELINQISQALDGATLAELNRRVDMSFATSSGS